MRQLIAVALFCVGLFCIAQAQVPMTGAGLGAPASAPAGCSQATNFIARETNPTNNTLITTMICGMVTDSTFSLLDGFYFFAATADTTPHAQANALLNLVSSSFNGTISGSPTFTSGQGFTGDASAAFINTGFNANTAGGNYTLNSTHVGGYVLSSRTTSQLWHDFGASDGVTTTEGFIPLFSGQYLGYLNDLACTVGTNTNAQGFWIQTRVSSSHGTIYQNDASFADNAACNSVGLVNQNFYVLARDTNGTADRFTGDQLAAVFWGGALTSSQEHLIACRVNAAMTTLGINVYSNSGC